jgi:2-polyprenyl-6-hydroxyphenyl methylase/3-demethylubiquinone-9 3-methyltransferase
MNLRWKIAQWFELQWWRQYLRNKDKEDYLAWKKNYWYGLLNKISTEIKIDASKSVIDMGCGPAGIFIALPDNKVTAIDPLLDEYEQQTHFFKKSDYPGVRFVKTSIEDFEAEGINYDAVFCMNAINHVHDIECGFEKLKDVCAVNGVIVVSIDAHNFSFFKYLFRLIPGDILHPHQYDLNEYYNFLEKGELRISTPVLLKHEFFFDHYLLVAKKVQA